MSIEITARHMHATKEIQDSAHGKAQFIIEEFPQVEHIHVILDHVRHQGVAEVVIQAKGHIRVEAKDEGASMQGCLDSVFVKVERQLRRELDKRHDHKAAMREKGPTPK